MLFGSFVSAAIVPAVPTAEMVDKWHSSDIIARRTCFLNALRKELAYDLNQNYFMMGCNSEPLWGFVEWAKKIGCGFEQIEGDGTLYLHTAWTGSIDATLHNKSSVRRDFEALVE